MIIDPSALIKRMPAMLALSRPYFKEGLDNPVALADEIQSGGFKKGPVDSGISLVDLLNEAYEKQKNPLFKGRVHKYVLHENLVSKRLNRLKGKIPIVINGRCITDETFMLKKGVDPYSYNHVFSNYLINWMNNQGKELPINFLQDFVFMYVQPVLYFQMPVEKEGRRGLEDLFKKDIEEEINSKLVERGLIPFGSLEKFWFDRSIGNSEYDALMFGVDKLDSALRSTPELYDEEIKKAGGLNRFRKLAQYFAYINKRLMGLKFSRVFEEIGKQCLPEMMQAEINGIPIYMEKTSDSFDILMYAQKSSGIQTHLIGGDSGIIATNRKPSLRGIADPSSMKKLIGFMSQIYSIKHKENLTTGFSLPESLPRFQMSRSARNPFVLYSIGKYPWFLLESGTERTHPNLHDIVDEYFYPNKPSDEEPDLEKLKEQRKLTGEFLKNSCIRNRIAYSRIEHRLVELFSINHEVYNGLRSLSKLNLSWHHLIHEKEILTPLEVLKGNPCLREEKGDFRGSEFSMATTPPMNKAWFRKFEKGKIYAGCALEKLLSRMDNLLKRKIIAQELEKMPGSEVAEFLKYHEPETFKSFFALTGTAVHHVSSEPLESLVHYKTLELIGMKPISSDNYCELGFCHNMTYPSVNGQREVKVSFHPDALLFLKKDDVYDILVIDTKTNPVRQYPEHRYLMQIAGVYGLTLMDILEKSGKKPGNIYAVLNKNAFHLGIDADIVVKPHRRFRAQRFAPITRSQKGDSFSSAAPYMVGQLLDEKEMLMQASNAEISDYKKQQDKCGACKKCFAEAHLVCNSLERTKGYKGVLEF